MYISLHVIGVRAMEFVTCSNMLQVIVHMGAPKKGIWVLLYKSKMTD